MSFVKWNEQDALCGCRVELSPACDLWMQGARFGSIVAVDRQSKLVRLRMDHPQVKKLQAVRSEYVRSIAHGAEYDSIFQ